MNIKDAVRSIIRPHQDDPITPLTTIWGDSLDPEHVLQEYPRPQLQRDSYYNLNGLWDYAITKSETTSCSDSLHNPPVTTYDGQILVPFSPECSLSGVERQLKPDEYLWYHTLLPDSACRLPKDHRLILHFGAVDYEAEVYINSKSVFHHKGGYTPFEVDITEYLTLEESGCENHLALRVKDVTNTSEQPRGKQTLMRGGIFYTAQSGIWQTVWLEQVPSIYVRKLWFESVFDERKLIAHLTLKGCSVLPAFSFSLYDGEQEVAFQSFHIEHTESTSKEPDCLCMTFSVILPENHFHPWNPESPFLYDIRLTIGSDRLQSYFAMRHFSIEKHDKMPVFCLNHEPYFLMGVLDQGYWPDGLYTAPSDEALIFDIETVKKLGYNMLRKHIKIESARYYYHCDRLGMIVCQDMINGGGSYSMPLVSYLPTVSQTACRHIPDNQYALFSRTDASARKQWKIECRDMIEHLKFFPSIAIWCPFNEGWGQFDAVRVTEMIRKLDPSRLIDSTSGWFDQGCGDFVSVHNYFRALSVPKDSVPAYRLRGNSCKDGRAGFLSEYGGLACRIEGHSSVDRAFGYKCYDTLDELQDTYQKLIEKSLLPLRQQGLSGAVYTQVSDVEEEVNGLMTYDRRILKLPNPIHL